MDFRIGYRRPLRTVSLLRKKRQRLGLCIVAAVAVAAAVVAMTWAPAQPRTVAVAAPVFKFVASSPVPAAIGAPRRIYPYSIVPGGVASREDLQRRVSTDQVVARHYASFDIAKARAVTVSKPRAVHVSYRKGDKVYWTAGKVMLAAGETLLSDGASEIRGRCGNRISDQALLPVAMNEPTEQELDASMNAAPDADEGGLQNASFGLDDAPAGSATAFQRFATFAQADAPPASPYTKTEMPAMPAFSNGVTDSSGQGTRFLTVSSGPTDALAPTTEASATVTPDAATGTPAVPADPAGTTATAPATTPATPVTANVPATPVAATPGTPAAAGPAASTPATPGVPATTALPAADIPEPATLWLSGVAGAAMLLARRRKTRRRDA